MDTSDGQIEKLLAREDWPGARRAIRQALRREPRSHWLMTRMGLTLYEERRYREALKWSKAALRVAPWCPLVLWDYAGDLEMLGRSREAASMYRRLLRRGVERIARGECGEGVRWARGVIADSHYRLACIHKAAGRRVAALREIEEHLSLRGPGCASIYGLSEMRSFKRGLEGTGALL